MASAVKHLCQYLRSELARVDWKLYAGDSPSAPLAAAEDETEERAEEARRSVACDEEQCNRNE